MNPLFYPTLLLTAVWFFIGLRISCRVHSYWLPTTGVLLAIPAIIFAAYYSKIFGEAIWLYQIRSLPFTELAAASIGFLAGWLQYQRQSHPQWNRRISGFFIPFLTVLCVSMPYLKQIFLRPDWSQFKNRWIENVCVQSSESSCGPASAATLLHYFGKTGTELEIARESYTSRRGTENWYLIRSIRRRGLNADYAVITPDINHLPYPSIAGVKLNHADGSGHFIALLGRTGDKFIVRDPLMGREELPLKELADRYTFTGFFLTFKSDAVAQ